MEIIFDTAWSTPTGIWERLFKYLDNLLKVGYPGINCTIAYADEDVGSNTSEIIYSAGNISFTEDSTYSDSIARYIDVWCAGDCPRFYQDENGDYHYYCEEYGGDCDKCPANC